MAAGDQHWTRLTGTKVFFADLPAVFAGRNPDADVILVLHHDAIGRAIDPVVFRIAHDHEIIGADEATAVVLVQLWDWKF